MEKCKTCLHRNKSGYDEPCARCVNSSYYIKNKVTNLTLVQEKDARELSLWAICEAPNLFKKYENSNSLSGLERWLLEEVHSKEKE